MSDDSILVRTIACEEARYRVTSGPCPILGDVDGEVSRAVAAHVRAHGTPPDAVGGDDAVLSFRGADAALSLVRVASPRGDPHLSALLDPAGALALRTGATEPPAAIAHAPGLVRLVGWAERAPRRDIAATGPRQRARSILIRVTGIVDAATAIGCLHALRNQALAASCTIVLDDRGVDADARAAIDVAVERLFGPDGSIAVRPAGGEDRADVTVTLAASCRPVGAEAIQALADWALEPGVAVAVPRLFDPAGDELDPAYPPDLTQRDTPASGPCRAVARGRPDGVSLRVGTPAMTVIGAAPNAAEPQALEAGLACDDPAAAGVLAAVALYRRAWRYWRDPDLPRAAALDDAFRDLLDERLPPGASAAARRLHEDRLTARIKAVCAAFAAAGLLDRGADSLDFLQLVQSFSPRGARTPAAPAAEVAVEVERDPDPTGAFHRHTDPPAGAAERLLVVADAFGPSQQLMFLHALAAARRDGRVAVRLLDEANVRALMARADGAARLEAVVGWWRPTAIVFSRYADAAGLAWLQPRLAASRAPRILHLDDDLFALPAQIDVERYRVARHPARIHALARLGATCDLVLATSPVLAGRLAARFGRPVGWCDPGMVGVPAAARPTRPVRTIGYFGSASHDQDLAMIAPALRATRSAHPDLRIEIVGSVAKRPAARALGDVATLRTDIVADYPAFRAAMRGWDWDVGLAPLHATAFNAAKTPVKWAEYAQAGIAVLASANPPYLDLARRGALLAVRPDAWHGALEMLLRNPARCTELVQASSALLRLHDAGATERRILGLIGRARRAADAARSAAA